MGPLLEYRVSARRIDAHGSTATTKDAEVILDTDINGGPDAFTIQTDLQTPSILRGGNSRLSLKSLRLRGHVSLFLRRPSTGIFGGFSGLSGPHS